VLLAVLAGLGFGGGFLAGLLGIGGGVVMVPALLYLPPLLGVAGPDLRQVAGMTMVQVFAASALAYWVNRRRRTASPRVVRWMGGGMVVGTGVGALTSGFVGVWVLQATFAVLVLVTAPLLFLRPPADEVGEGPAREFSPLLGAGLALGVGLLSGLVGIGGAFLLIPLMIYALGLPTRLAIGSSLGILVAGGLVGAVAKLETGQVPRLWAAVLCAGTVPGSLVGAYLSARVPARRLRLVLAVLVSGIAVRMLWTLPAALRAAP
jgi:uncharacterized membrane protein YfcA